MLLVKLNLEHRIVELRHHLRLLSAPPQLVQRRLRWFGHAAKHPVDELIREPPLHAPPRSWRN